MSTKLDQLLITKAGKYQNILLYSFNTLLLDNKWLCNDLSSSKGVKFNLTSYAQCGIISGVMKELVILVTLLLGISSNPVKQDPCKDCGPVAERLTEAEDDNPYYSASDNDEIELKAVSAEVIADRLMEELIGAKNKFQAALTHLDKAISSD